MTGQHDLLFRALADPTRRAVLERLMGGEAAVGDLTAGLQVSQPAVSQHLAMLRDAGLVAVRREGRHRFYRATPAALAPLVDWLAHYQRFWSRRLARLKTILEDIE